MTSILNNIAANTALLNLQNTVQNLRDTQQRISTGFKIGSAADNAAYFAISTVLKSDSNALSTVSDTLNLGGSSLGVATNAFDKIQTTLSDIKDQLLAATTPGIDRVKIQAQIAQDQAQLENIANSANFNGQNFLSHIQARQLITPRRHSSHRSRATPPAGLPWGRSRLMSQKQPFLIRTAILAFSTTEHINRRFLRPAQTG